MTRKVLLVITGIFLLAAVFSGCMQSTVQPSQPTEDEVLLSQGLKVLSDGNIENKNQALEAFRKSCELGNTGFMAAIKPVLPTTMGYMDYPRTISKRCSGILRQLKKGIFLHNRILRIYTRTGCWKVLTILKDTNG